MNQTDSLLLYDLRKFIFELQNMYVFLRKKIKTNVNGTSRNLLPEKFRNVHRLTEIFTSTNVIEAHLLDSTKCITLGKCMLETRKIKGGICCGGHLAVTYGGKLLYLRIFS